MRTALETHVSREAGVVGDFRGQPGKRQVSLVFAADWAAACADLGQDAPWTLRRANFLVEGLANPRMAGGRVRIGAALLEVTGETDPCARMDAQLQGLRAALTPDWRGGVLARVLEAGAVRVGDAAAFET